MPSLDNSEINTSHQSGTSQLQITELELPSTPSANPTPHKGRYRTINRPSTSPNLFPDARTSYMASNRLIWEGCNILTQGRDLNWAVPEQGPPYYEVPVAKGKGYITFWVTDELPGLQPAILEGEAALALIEQFDIRAACMHLIYAAHATQLDRPWEQQFVLSDIQLERYLGLNQNKKLNKQQKLQLMLELARQPCNLLVYVSWPSKGAVSSFSVSRTWLWEIAEPILHFQDCFQDREGNPIGEQKLVGFTLKIRCGNWAQYFLNQEKCRNKLGYYEYGILSQGLLHDLMSLWHHNEGAVRLMTWLLFKTKVNQTSPLTVETLMNVAFGTSLIEAAKASSNERKKLLRRWETALRVLLERGWNIKHDPDTYPLQYWPALLDTEPLAQIPDNPEEAAQFWSEDADLSSGARLTDLTRRTRRSFEQLLSGKLWILPPADIAGKLDEIDECKKKKRKKDLAKKQSAPSQDYSALTGQQLKDQRISLGLSQRDLSTLTGISQKMISLLENGERRLSETNRERLLKVFSN